MTELSEVLELLHRGGSGISTLSATMRHWVDMDRQHAAFERAASESGNQGFSMASMSASRPGPPPHRRQEYQLTFRYRSPDKYRSEQGGNTPYGPPKSLHIRDGTRSWSYFPGQSEAVYQDTSRGEPQLDEFLDPSWLAAAYQLTVTGRTTHEERPAITLTGLPRPIQRAGDHHRLGAEEIRASIDAETGLLLELTSIFEGEPFSIQGLHDLIIGEPLDDDLFQFTPPPGVEVKDVEAQFPMPRRVRWLMPLHWLWLWRMRRKRIAWYGPAREHRKRRWWRS
ncbi:MAG TPA: hypothetical protein VF995_03775 [Actinomycetota bacterium]